MEEDTLDLVDSSRSTIIELDSNLQFDTSSKKPADDTDYNYNVAAAIDDLNNELNGFNNFVQVAFNNGQTMTVVDGKEVEETNRSNVAASVQQQQQQVESENQEQQKPNENETTATTNVCDVTLSSEYFDATNSMTNQTASSPKENVEQLDDTLEEIMRTGEMGTNGTMVNVILCEEVVMVAAAVNTSVGTACDNNNVVKEVMSSIVENTVNSIVSGASSGSEAVELATAVAISRAENME